MCKAGWFQLPKQSIGWLMLKCVSGVYPSAANNILFNPRFLRKHSSTQRPQLGWFGNIIRRFTATKMLYIYASLYTSWIILTCYIKEKTDFNIVLGCYELPIFLNMTIKSINVPFTNTQNIIQHESSEFFWFCKNSPKTAPHLPGQYPGVFCATLHAAWSNIEVTTINYHFQDSCKIFRFHVKLWGCTKYINDGHWKMY